MKSNKNVIGVGCDVLCGSSFTVMKVISSHPDWDDYEGDSEYEIAHFEHKEDADAASKNLGASNGDAAHRAYRHYVRKSLPNVEVKCGEPTGGFPPSLPPAY